MGQAILLCRRTFIAGVFTLFGLVPSLALGQDTKTDTPATKAEAPKAATPKPPTAAPAVLELDAPIWAEAHRDALMRNSFRELTGPPLSAEQLNSVLEMARGDAPSDAVLIKRYVDYYAAELTRRPNLDAMMGTEGADARRARDLDKAANGLIAPLNMPVSSNNQAFRRVYTNQLKSVAPALLEGHLFSRSFIMVVLSRVATSDFVPLFIEAIASDEQPYTVKMLAASGLIAASQGGRRPLDPNREGIPAAQALLAFLEADPSAPWPVQARCLEALGVLRQSTADPVSRSAEFADLPFQILMDEKVDPQLRAWAAWSLSRLAYPGLGGAPNLEAVAYALGKAAVAAGEKIVAIPVPAASPTKNLKLVARGSEPLVRILEAFEGEPELRGSGFKALAAGSSAMRGVEERIRALTSASVLLSQSAGSQVNQSREAVQAAVTELKSYLAANPPKKPEFYTGGPSIATKPVSDNTQSPSEDSKQP